MTQVNVQRGVVVDLEHPDFQVLVNEDVEAEDLEAVAFTFVPAASKLKLLFDQRVRLHRQQGLFAAFTNLVKQVVSVDVLVFPELVQNG